VFIIFQIGLFLLVGSSLWLAGADDLKMRATRSIPRSRSTSSRPGSPTRDRGHPRRRDEQPRVAVNSLASASTHDFYAPLTGRHDPRHLLWVGRWLTLFWTTVWSREPWPSETRNTPVVQLALSVTSVTWGSLLGTYVLGGVWQRAVNVTSSSR